MPPDPVYDDALFNSLATVQAQLNTINSSLLATPAPVFSSSIYAVPVSSPTNTIVLKVDHTVSVGELMVSVFLFLALCISILRILFNGLRGVSV